jgi:hypothetical protein
MDAAPRYAPADDEYRTLQVHEPHYRARASIRASASWSWLPRSQGLPAANARYRLSSPANRDERTFHRPHHAHTIRCAVATCPSDQVGRRRCSAGRPTPCARYPALTEPQHSAEAAIGQLPLPPKYVPPTGSFVSIRRLDCISSPSKRSNTPGSISEPLQRFHVTLRQPSASHYQVARFETLESACDVE